MITRSSSGEENPFVSPQLAYDQIIKYSTVQFNHRRVRWRYRASKIAPRLNGTQSTRRDLSKIIKFCQMGLARYAQT
ncbi:hypothetical protein GWI33_016315 [Rhynchophorus ferrugineus]|uniref:Uncharacterized protein n=1 Tax=Rhynchophorus ferrugineus TaxID=354439 RepID=A0A834M533_RHYFE|nr:hypothetical protein GWI33_016315 [Rhynchophorus ferrugineus]